MVLAHLDLNMALMRAVLYRYPNVAYPDLAPASNALSRFLGSQLSPW